MAIFILIGTIIFVIVISPLALFLSFLFSSRKGDAWKLTNWPIVGVLPGFLCNLSNILEFLNQILGKNGWTFVFRDMVVTSDPMNVHHILTKNFTNYSKSQLFQEIFEVLGDGIFVSNSDLWKSQRKSIHSLIKNSKVERYLENITQRKVEKGLFSVLDYVSEQGIMVDLQDILKRFTFDTYCLLVLGYNPNCLSVEFPEFFLHKALEEMEEATFHRTIVAECWWKLQKWLQLGEEKKLTRAWRIVDKFLYECVSLKQENLSRMKIQLEEEEELDLLKTFIVAEEGDKSKIFLRDMAMNLLSAGRGTLSAALTWFFWLIATHPSVENKILQEIKSNITQTDHDHQQDWLDGKIFFNKEKMKKLVYLHATLCETLRLYPPLPITSRTSAQADNLPSGHHINQKGSILLCFYAMGRMEEIWGKDCLDFKPERWISENGCIVQFPSYKSSTFSAGPRTCLGKYLSFIQMKMVAASVVWNYHMQVAENHPISPNNPGLLSMKYGLKVRVVKRHFL